MKLFNTFFLCYEIEHKTFLIIQDYAIIMTDCLVVIIKKKKSSDI